MNAAWPLRCHCHAGEIQNRYHTCMKQNRGKWLPVVSSVNSPVAILFSIDYICAGCGELLTLLLTLFLSFGRSEGRRIRKSAQKSKENTRGRSPSTSPQTTGLRSGQSQIVLSADSWGRSSAWLERLPVTQEVEGSSPFGPAVMRTPAPSAGFFVTSPGNDASFIAPMTKPRRIWLVDRTLATNDSSFRSDRTVLA